MFFVCPINNNLYVIILATRVVSGTFSDFDEVVSAKEADRLMANCKESEVEYGPGRAQYIGAFCESPDLVVSMVHA